MAARIGTIDGLNHHVAEVSEYVNPSVFQVNTIHVQGVPPPSLPVTPRLSCSGKPSLSFGLSPHPQGYMTSSRPPSAMEVRFEDEVRTVYDHVSVHSGLCVLSEGNRHFISFKGSSLALSPKKA